MMIALGLVALFALISVSCWYDSPETGILVLTVWLFWRWFA